MAAGIRSKLFVPGSRTELFSKALASASDALSFDLEDSVVPAMKHDARHAVAAFLRETWDAEGFGGKVTIVRVNGLASGHFAADVAAVCMPGLDVINVPKVESAEDVWTSVQAIEQAEQAGSVRPVGILANIETPKGLRMAYEIAASHPRVVGLQIGFVDLSLACGMDEANVFALNAVRFAVRAAATEAGIAAFDGAYTNVKNLDGFRAQAEEAQSLGLTGKSCIHPSQVAVANDVFAPKTELVQNSLRIVQAAEDAVSRGVGAFQLDGKMIDVPIVERARQVVLRAERYGISMERGE